MDRSDPRFPIAEFAVSLLAVRGDGLIPAGHQKEQEQWREETAEIGVDAPKSFHNWSVVLYAMFMGEPFARERRDDTQGWSCGTKNPYGFSVMP